MGFRGNPAISEAALDAVIGRIDHAAGCTSWRQGRPHLPATSG
jgi:hypothetical protein